MYPLWDAVFIQVLDRTGTLMLNLSGTPHIPVVACISAAGEYMTPFLICSQGNAAVERKLKIEGFRMGVDLILKGAVG
jgi:hypothetical protein